MEGGDCAWNQKLVFTGTEAELYSVMNYISENKIPFVKLERKEATLESLFLEVVGK